MLFFVLALNNKIGPWGELLEKGPESTWLESLPKGQYLKYSSSDFSVFDLVVNKTCETKVAHLFRRNKRIYLEKIEIEEKPNCSLIVNTHENWLNHTLKTLKAIEYVQLHKRFDYLIRINSTAYIDLNKLKVILEKANYPDYAGPMQEKKTFVSGWAVILSNRAVNCILKAGIQTALFDDEYIGNIMKESGIKPQKIEFREISDAYQLKEASLLNDENISLIRFKSKSMTERNDADLMRLYHVKKTFENNA